MTPEQFVFWLSGFLKGMDHMESDDDISLSDVLKEVIKSFHLTPIVNQGRNHE